ncbi:MAG: hypothetical protein ACP5NW_02745 [Candidatus Woesearchaeota archaeon]
MVNNFKTFREKWLIKCEEIKKQKFSNEHCNRTLTVLEMELFSHKILTTTKLNDVRALIAEVSYALNIASSNYEQYKRETSWWALLCSSIKNIIIKMR